METLYDKLWKRHIVGTESGRPTLLYVDLHLIHEVTTPQAFTGLAERGLSVRRPEFTIGTIDHSVPTRNRMTIPVDSYAAKQIEVFRKNCREHNIKFFDIDSDTQGIVHVFAPEVGLSQPGMTIVCGDSHTSTHGAFGALAFGIGTSEVEQVLATQCILQTKSDNMLIKIDGTLHFGVTAKDLILHIIGKIGTDGARDRVIEYAGETIENMSMEERLTICNMSIEAGSRSGLIGPDQTTFDYLKGLKYAPKGNEWDKAVEDWLSLTSDTDAIYQTVIEIDAGEIEPQVSWGTTPAMVAPISGVVPDPQAALSADDRELNWRALAYMDLEPHRRIRDIKIDHVFIGSCTNSRIEDLRAAAKVVRGYRVKDGVTAIVVPGSQAVKKMAEDEGLAGVFIDAGYEWRDSGCSMCVAMNGDFLHEGERCASTSNRNFEGRQGRGGRTHLVSPMMAAAASITGHFVDVRDWKFNKTSDPK